MKLQDLQEARLHGSLPGLYQRYDYTEISRADGGEMGLVSQEDFKLELNDGRAMHLLASLVDEEFSGIFDGDFHNEYPSYVNSPSYHKLMKSGTIISCGADWGEGGDWYFAFNAGPEQVYRVLENLIREMPAAQFEQEIYDEKTEEHVQDVLREYRKQLKLK